MEEDSNSSCLFGPMTLSPNAKTQKDSKRHSRGFLRFISSSVTR